MNGAEGAVKQQLAQLKGQLEAARSPTEIMRIVQQAREAMKEAGGGMEMDGDSPEARWDRFFREMEENDQKVRDKAKDVTAKYATDAQKDTLTTLETNVDEAKKAVEEAKKTGDSAAVQQAAEERKKAYEALYDYRADLFPQLRERALAAGDMEAVKVIDEVIAENTKGLEMIEGFKQRDVLEQQKKSSESVDDYAFLLDEPSNDKPTQVKQTEESVELGNLTSPQVGVSNLKSTDIGRT